MSRRQSKRARKLPRILRIVRARPRLFLCAALTLVIILLLPGDWRWPTRFLVGWDIGVAVYLVAAFAAMADCDVDHIRRRSALMDEGRIAIPTLTACAALASLGGDPDRARRQGRHPRPAAPCARRRHHRAVLGVHPHDLRAALCARVLRREPLRGRRPRLSGQGQARLLGLSLFLAGHRHDVAGFGRGGDRQGDPPHRHGARGGVVLLQCHAGGADGQHRGERAGGVRRFDELASWPGLSRPSTSCLLLTCKDVDARDMRGHDVRIGPYSAAVRPAPPLP